MFLDLVSLENDCWRCLWPPGRFREAFSLERKRLRGSSYERCQDGHEQLIEVPCACGAGAVKRLTGIAMTDSYLESAEPAEAPLKGHAYYQLAVALDCLDGRSHGFVRDDIESVEAFWTSLDRGGTTCGFVGPLRDGERFYLESRLDERAPESDTRIKARRLAREQIYPELEGDRLPSSGWSDDTGSLNRLLAPGRS